MKTIIILATILTITNESVSAQIKDQNKTKYGFSLIQFKSQSGFQQGYDIHFTIQPSNRSKVGFGVFIDNESKNFSGLSLNHQWMLFTKKTDVHLIQPYIMYNFIYRKTKTPELLATNEGISLGSNWVTYTSMEHHIGIGFDINISKFFFVDFSAGYGIYMGSIKKPSAPDPLTKEIIGTNGKGIIFKTGVGFKF